MDNVEKAIAELQNEARTLVMRRESYQSSLKDIDVRLTQIVGGLQALNSLLEPKGEEE